MPSRPNIVLNHGMPAYGYGPCGVSRDHHRDVGPRSLEPLVEQIARRAHPRRARPQAVDRRGRLHRAPRRSDRRAARWRGVRPQTTATKTSRRWPGSTVSATRQHASDRRPAAARSAPSCCRATPSSPWYSKSRPSAVWRGGSRRPRAGRCAPRTSNTSRKSASNDRSSDTVIGARPWLTRLIGMKQVRVPQERRAPYVHHRLGPQQLVIGLADVGIGEIAPSARGRRSRWTSRAGTAGARSAAAGSARDGGCRRDTAPAPNRCVMSPKTSNTREGLAVLERARLGIAPRFRRRCSRHRVHRATAFMRYAPRRRPRLDSAEPLVDRHVVARHALGGESPLEAARHAARSMCSTPPQRVDGGLDRIDDPAGHARLDELGHRSVGSMRCTGVPHDSASITTMPNGSGQSIGNSSARAPPSSVGLLLLADLAEITARGLVQQRLDLALEVVASTASTFAAIRSSRPARRAISMARSTRFSGRDAADERDVVLRRRAGTAAGLAAARDTPSRTSSARRAAAAVRWRSTRAACRVNSSISGASSGRSSRPCSVVTEGAARRRASGRCRNPVWK